MKRYKNKTCYYNRRIRSSIVLTAALFLTALNLSAGPVVLQPIKYATEHEGQTITTTIFPRILMEPDESDIIVHLDIDGDLSDAQQKFPGILNGNKKREQCGERIDLRNTALELRFPVVAVHTVADYSRWHCAFGVEALLLEQSTKVTTDVFPVIENNSIRLETRVSSAAPEGLMGEAVKMLGLERLLEAEVEKFLKKALNSENLVLSIPPEAKKYNPVLKSVKLMELGKPGKLGVNLKVDLRVTPDQLAEIMGKL